MSDTEFDVVIAAYLVPDLGKQDFDALVALVGDKELEVEGVALVTLDPNGEVTVDETGDHLGRKGAKIGGGVGLAVGLLAPPLLGATVVGAGSGGGWPVRQGGGDAGAVAGRAVDVDGAAEGLDAVA